MSSGVRRSSGVLTCRKDPSAAWNLKAPQFPKSGGRRRAKGRQLKAGDRGTLKSGGTRPLQSKGGEMGAAWAGGEAFGARSSASLEELLGRGQGAASREGRRPATPAPAMA